MVGPLCTMDAKRGLGLEHSIASRGARKRALPLLIGCQIGLVGGLCRHRDRQHTEIGCSHSAKRQLRVEKHCTLPKACCDQEGNCL